MSPSASPREREKILSSVVHDEARLKALRRYQILDTAPESAFDRATALAAHLFDAPTALVNFIAEERQWFKSTIGFDERETTLDKSFCVYTLAADDVFVIEDLSEEEAFVDNPYVRDHGLRFYTGAPLTTPDDHRIGTLCVLDTEPQSPSTAPLERLSDLAAMVMDELELRREQTEHKHTLAALEENRKLLRQAEALADVGGTAYDPQSGEMRWTEQTYRIFGYAPDADLDRATALDRYTSESRSTLRAEIDRLRDEGGQYELELDVMTPDNEYRRVRTVAEAQRDDGTTTQIVGAVQNITEQYRDRRLQKVQSHFFERIATGTPTDEVLADIAHFIEDELSGATVSILRRDDNRLYHAAGPSLSEAFITAIDGLDIGPASGPCGAAAYHNREIIADDLREDDRFEQVREIAEQAGIRACHSTVIKGSDGTVLGTLAVYRKTPGRPPAPEYELVDRMSHVASVALERKQRERALRESEKQFRTIVENAQPVTFMIDRDGTFLLSEGTDLAALGLEPGDVVGESVYDLYAEHPEVIAAIDRALDGTPVDEEVTVNDVIFDFWSSPFYDEDGTVAGVIGMAADITERRQTQRALQENYQRLRLALEAADAGTFEFEIGTGQAQLSDRTIDLFGLEGDTPVVAASVFEDIILDDGFKQLVDTFDQPADEKRSQHEMSYRIRRPDTGDVRHIRSRGLTLRDEDGTPERVIGISQDVTERRRRKEMLERQNDLFKKAQDIADVGAWEYDVQLGETTVTDKTYEIHGMAPDAHIVPDQIIDLFHPDDQSTLQNAFRRAIEEDESYDLELRLTTADGEQRWVRTRGEPQTENGEVVRLRGTIQNITDRKETEQALRHHREQLSMAVEGGNIGTWNWDLETDEVIFNHRWAEMLGYTREELDFHFNTWEDLVHADDLVRAKQELTAYIEGDSEIYNPEIRMRTKSGEWKWIQTIGKVIERDEDGAVTRAAGIHLDIDERKRAEMALRKAKGRYQTLVEHFPDGGVALFNDDLRYTIAGGQELEAIGLSRAEFEGSTPRDLFPTEFAETTIAHYRRALNGEKDIFEQTLAGQHYRVQTVPVRNDEGDVIAGMAVAQNITERKTTRLRLERYHEYTDRLLDAVDDLFFALDDQAQLQRWNARVPGVTGYSEDELEGMEAFDLVPESERERLAARIAKAFTAGSAQVEIPILRKDGTTLPYEFAGSLVEHPNGDFQIVGIGRDLTERKRKERLLRQAETFFQHAQDALFLIDVEHTTDEPAFVVERVNPAYEEATGLRGSDICGRSPQDLLDEEGAQHQEALYRTCVAERQPLEYEEEIPSDGATTYWQTRIAPVVVDGEVQQIAGTTRNVTERVHRRQELKTAKEAAEKADRTKTALLSNMNHEFRTPLTSIITFSKLIRDNPDVAGQFADRILNGGHRLLHTLNTVMELAELEGDGIATDPGSLRLGDVVWSVISHFRERTEDDIDLCVDLSAETQSVRLDEHLTERILTHLVHNAIKFTEEGSITVSARTDPTEATLTVTDPGIGIDPDFLPHVFDEFTQASSGNTRSHEGNGIGLTVVQRMVQQMNGTIDIESTPGKGTTVTVRLPVE